jgi:regulator of chromosome condensation
MEEEKKASEEEVKKEEDAPQVEMAIDTSSNQVGENPQTQAGMTQGTAAKKRKTATKTKEEKFAEKEEDLNGIGYFNVPHLVEKLWSDEAKVIAKACYAKGNYSYILETPEGNKSNQLYSWGMGENYVLGSRDDDNQFYPYKVHPKMFEEFPVLQVGAGTQHVVVLTTDNQDN